MVIFHSYERSLIDSSPSEAFLDPCMSRRPAGESRVLKPGAALEIEGEGMPHKEDLGLA